MPELWLVVVQYWCTAVVYSWGFEFAHERYWDNSGALAQERATGTRAGYWNKSGLLAQEPDIGLNCTSSKHHRSHFTSSASLLLYLGKKASLKPLRLG